MSSGVGGKKTTYVARNQVRLQLSIVPALAARGHVVVVHIVVVVVVGNVVDFDPGVARKVRGAACVFFAVVLIGTRLGSIRERRGRGRTLKCF